MNVFSGVGRTRATWTAPAVRLVRQRSSAGVRRPAALPISRLNSGNAETASMRRSLDDGSASGYGSGSGSRSGTGFRPRGRSDPHNKYSMFGRLVEGRFQAVTLQLGRWTADHQEYLSFGLSSQSEVDRQVKLFGATLKQCMRLAKDKHKASRADNPLFWSLRNAFVRGDVAGLTTELKYAFLSFVLRSREPHAVTALQESIADFRQPYEWYPATRTMQRTVHLHVGPTNSGKTYRALLALEQARTGIYAGPLRLLAHEIYSRFTAKGKPCALITGEEQRLPDGDGDDNADVAGPAFQSCTVEMTPLNQRVDVAVIDEIQMIGDPDRGWAWTQAFLGVQAREVHLCGEARVVDLVQALCAHMGDACVVHRYERLSALQTMSTSLRGDFGNLRKGDAVVAFSRVGLHTLKLGIEKMTGRRCAIVYGSLPPETRAQQAALFNDPDNDYDFLVASDAIGMGLNLEVKRVIFETATKHDGMSFRHLTVPEIKQIGGRAGRYRTAQAAVKQAAAATAAAPAPGKKWGTPGFVATLEDEDLPVVQAAFQTEAPPLEAAGIQPPMFAMEQFARYFPPETPFSFILMRLRELAKVSGLFQMCTTKEQIAVADIIQPYPMSIQDRCIFIAAPCSLRDPGQKQVLAALAWCVSEMRGGHLLDIPEIDLEILDATREDYAAGPERYLYHLEALHKAITLYLWLSYRYVGVFTSQDLAFHVKSLVEDKITDYLDNLTFVEDKRKQRAKRLRSMAQRKERAKQMIEDFDSSSTDEPQAIEPPAVEPPAVQGEAATAGPVH